MDLHVPSSLVGAGKAAATGIASERFLTRVCSDVCCEMIRAGEISHADATLEWLLAGVGPHMTSEFIGTRESSRTCFNRASIWSFAWWSFCSLCELVVTLHFQDAATSFCGSVVVDRSRFGNLHDVVVEKVVRCGIQEFVKARVELKVLG